MHNAITRLSLNYWKKTIVKINKLLKLKSTPSSDLHISIDSAKVNHCPKFIEKKLIPKDTVLSFIYSVMQGVYPKANSIWAFLTYQCIEIIAFFEHYPDIQHNLKDANNFQI
jgi:hypothetical protein